MLGNVSFIVSIVRIKLCAWGGLLVLMGGPGPLRPPLGYGPEFMHLASIYFITTTDAMKPNKHNTAHQLNKHEHTVRVYHLYSVI